MTHELAGPRCFGPDEYPTRPIWWNGMHLRNRSPDAAYGLCYKPQTFGCAALRFPYDVVWMRTVGRPNRCAIEWAAITIMLLLRFCFGGICNWQIRRRTKVDKSTIRVR